MSEDTTSTDTSNNFGPLAGLRVVDWTMWQFGPVCSMMLADLGAEVIKVESLDGDHARQFHTVSGTSSTLPGGLNAYFESLNRQKKSIAVDLKNPTGLEIIRKLVKKSDIFVQNFRNGVAERLGLGYEELKEINPTIIYGAATGYGPRGPDSDKPAFAYTGEARSGSLWWAGPDDGNPYNLQSVADQISGIMLCNAILGALVHRNKTNSGQKVDVSHLGSMMWLGGNRYGMALLTGKEPGGQDRRSARNPLWNSYKCSDGKWIAFAMNQSDRYWPMFCEAIDRIDLVTNERYSKMEERSKNRVELIRILDEVFGSKPRSDWGDQMDKKDGIIWERVQDIWDLPEDPQVTENKYIIDFEHPSLGPVKYLQTPFGYSDTPLETRSSAPELGQHTEQILIDTLGYSWDDISRFQDEGAIL